ncbi:MAG TPA: leucine--tRNA ligase [Firmicutes bacterium]|jgi:leucyl-tRNA synthetase|nr:leucine--tRNA ligase [Bacillota bacterium]HCF89519.1 leucine--tRNA ligase [Bacillota bacterium]HCX71197.1 leucine--tRNA ligase [Bacillota bacterium]
MKDVRYNPQAIEKKWREHWKATNANQTRDDGRPKFYCLDMFPYPSGSGLHVGHWRGYVLSDVISRYKKFHGFDVLHPMGWDAFGLPAENDAITKGIHPKITTTRNIANFKRQLEEMGSVYDWSREINTTDPAYYKWTQWIFTQMFRHGLAYQKEMPINWCPQCQTGLANEEAAGGECERCGSPVTKRNMVQWMLKITAYAERLLNDLDQLDWPEPIIKMQQNWIGKSEGAEVDFAIENSSAKIRVFTTRPDTLFGATYMVLAPEHQLVSTLTSADQRTAVDGYIKTALAKSSVDRMASKDKTGAFTGSYAINPVSGERLPIWISDYVLIDYGTGAIMCVPGHDERDFDFAKTFGLPIRRVIATSLEDAGKPVEAAEPGEGMMVNSGPYNGMDWQDGKKAITKWLADKGIGQATVSYKLRDWVFSRQRYWGEPIPIIHCPHCGPVAVPDEDLPVMLPEVEKYQPTGTGESPLAAIEDWVQTTCPTCGRPGRRETNTMPQWAGSSWYFLRYIDPHNAEALCDKTKADRWMPVDLYVGGAEHAVLHLLYARFYVKFLKDIGVVSFDEPFQRLFNQGTIYYQGAKMSKSRGNVINPDDLVREYGTDALRLYELFIGPPEVATEWDDHGIDGVFRFLSRVWRLVTDNWESNWPETVTAKRATHRLIYEVTERFDSFRFNTGIAQMMAYLNTISAEGDNKADRTSLAALIKLIAPMAPHIAEELWQMTGHTGSVFESGWPVYDPALLVEETVTIVIQINGRVKDRLEMPKGISKEKAFAAAREASSESLAGKEIVKEIYVPEKIVNFVVK